MAKSKSRKRRERETGSNLLDGTARMNLGKRMSGAHGVHDDDKNVGFKASKTSRMATRQARKDDALRDFLD